MDQLHRCLVFSALCLLPISAAAVPFTRGDVDASGGISIVDAIRILEALFGGGSAISCEDAADVDDDGSLTVTDPIFLLESIFRRGLPPPAPFHGCGEDPTEDGLPCEAFESCSDFTFMFYGQELVGDAVFFVIDKSSTMQDTGELQRAKREVQEALSTMPDGTRFAVLFFDHGISRFPAVLEPAIASEETRSSARSFVNSIPAGAGVCGGAALLSAIESASLSGAGEKLILYVSDGSGLCGGEWEEFYLQRTLEDVTAFNSGLANIHTFGVNYLIGFGEAFLKDLPQRNGGVFVRA